MSPYSWRVLKPFYLEADAFDFVLDSILSQYGKDKQLHPIAFWFQKLSIVEIIYEIYDKGLVAIIDAFEEWCYLLEGVQHNIKIYTDYKNREYYMSEYILNHHQARWNMSLCNFEFVITYYLSSF